jgi:hypothetical protein
MGGKNSKSDPKLGGEKRGSKRSWSFKRGDESIVKLMLPVYYDSSTLSKEEVQAAKSSWDVIENDNSKVYKEKIKSSTFTKAFPTCKDWFSDLFYERLFDVHPLCKPMFKSSISKGSFIYGLLSFLFTILENKKEFHKRLLSIAQSHCHKGVKAVEYGVIGDVSFGT